MELSSNKILMDSEKKKKLLIFNQKPDNFPEWCEELLAYTKIGSVNLNSEKYSEANKDAVQRKVYQEFIMHLNDATLQLNIALNYWS